MRQKIEKLIIKAFRQLQPVTSKEIQKHLIKNEPEYFWSVRDIQSTLHRLSNKYPEIEYESIQTNRFKIKEEVEVTQDIIISRMKKHKGRFITATWETKKGTIATYNGRPTKEFFDNHGYIRLKKPNGEFRRITKETIIEVKQDGVTFKNYNYGKQN